MIFFLGINWPNFVLSSVDWGGGLEMLD